MAACRDLVAVIMPTGGKRSLAGGREWKLDGLLGSLTMALLRQKSLLPTHAITSFSTIKADVLSKIMGVCIYFIKAWHLAVGSLLIPL